MERLHILYGVCMMCVFVRGFVHSKGTFMHCLANLKALAMLDVVFSERVL